jgi:signal transduction histidine kinase
MKWHDYRPDRRSIRLALTYLVIIMVMSIVFSAIFFKTSLDNLAIQLHQGKPNTDIATTPSGKAVIYTNQNAKEIAALNYKIQLYTAQRREGLLQELALLNLGVLVVGSGVSYYLARRTLRPIEAAMKAQSQFASDASHELRTPLTIIQGEIEVALHNPQLTLARAKAALQTNHREIGQLRELSEGLLRLTHHTELSIQFSQFYADEIVGEAINRVLKLAKSKRITISDNIPKIIVSGDKLSLVQAIVILLDNAIKYSAPGKHISIHARASKRSVYISIQDEGTGIPNVALPHIFGRFYRVRDAALHHVDGHGLGLAIAQAIAAQHRGSITVQSTVGEGSTFTIQLPYSTKDRA